jgi:hypothetical protein
MPSRRQIVEITPLPTYPGYYLLSGMTEGEVGQWRVIRHPNGTYWAAVTPMGSGNGHVVEIGDKITDVHAIAQIEASYVALRQASIPQHIPGCNHQ